MNPEEKAQRERFSEAYNVNNLWGLDQFVECLNWGIFPVPTGSTPRGKSVVQRTT